MIDRLFKKLQIRYLYFWSMTIFVVLLFAIVIWISYYFSVQGIIQSTSSHQERILRQLSEKVQARLSLIESISLSAVRNNELMNMFSRPEESYESLITVQNVVNSLQTLTFSTSLILNIDVYVRDAPQSGKNDLVRFLEIHDAEREAWYPQIEHSDFAWIGEHRIHSYAGEVSVVSFARKFYSTSGDYKGIVMVNVKASEIRQLLTEEGVESNRQLFDSGGRLITRIGGDSVLYSARSGKPGEAAAAALPTGNGYRLIAGEALEVWTYLKGSGWLLVETTPWGELVEGSAHMAEILIGIGAATVCVLILYFLLLNRKFTQPIYLLLRAMNRFPADQDKANLPNDYQNEFGQLFRGYQKLLHRIAELYESLRIQYRKQKESEISALQAMINPHFLYNTLDQLNWMAIRDGNDRMSQVLELTGRMLRIGLSNGKSLIPLSDELELVECYMKIQQIRLGDRIRYTLDVPEELMKNPIPKMTLQPIVENCFRHGFHGRKHGEIVIRCSRDAHGLRITIEDDGKGLSSEPLSSRVRGGFGLHNVRQRLSAFYGEGALLDIRNRTGEGTIVTLHLPEMPDDETAGMEGST
jgi:two-component system sensor histidine kinase YesM